MFIQSILTVIMFFFAFLEMEAKIVETGHIEEVVHLIDEKTWLLVDLDNCMFEGAQALGHANWFYDELQKKCNKG